MSSVKAKLARKAVKTTAKHTAQGTAAKFARKPFRSVTLLALGVAIGGAVGWLIGRSSRGDDHFEPIASPPVPTGVVIGAEATTGDHPTTGNSAEGAPGTGAAS